MGHIFQDDVAEMSLSEEDEVPKAFVLDGFYEALGEGVAVWTPGRNLDAFDAVPGETLSMLEL